MAGIEKLVQLKSLMQGQQMQQGQIQMQQQQIQDKNARTQAMIGWDGKDPGDLAKSVLKNGGSADAATAVTQHFLQLKDTASQIALRDAQTGTANIDNILKMHDQILGALTPANDPKQVPDEQLGDYIGKQVQQLQASGMLKEPQVMQQVQQITQLAQTNPTAARQQLQVTEASLKGSKQQFEDAKSAAETAEANTESEEGQQKLAIIRSYQQNPQQLLWQVDAVAPPDKYGALNLRTKAQVHLAMSTGDVDGAKEAIKQASEQVGGIEKETNPAVQANKIATSVAEGKARAQIQAGGFGQPGDPMVDMVGQNRIDLATALQRVPPAQKYDFLAQLSQKYPSYNQGTFGIEKKVGTDFTSGDAAKSLTAFSTAIEHAGQLSKATDELDNTDNRTLNKIGNSLGYQFGSDKTTNFNVIKNALSGEISKVFKGGQATDAEIREVQGPFDTANSPEQLKGAIKNAIALMNSKRDALKQQYQSGVQGKPNFGGGTDPFSSFGGKPR